jgi:hypothetical protein
LNGRRTPGISRSNQRDKRLMQRKICLKLNGKRRLITKGRWRGRSSFSIEKGTSNSLDTMKLKRSLEKSSCYVKRKEISICFKVPSIGNRP